MFLLLIKKCLFAARFLHKERDENQPDVFSILDLDPKLGKLRIRILKKNSNPARAPVSQTS
jgi:hypothetical protein